MTRKHSVVATTLGMALTLLTGCEPPAANTTNAPKLQVHNTVVESNATPSTSATLQQTSPVTKAVPAHVSYPQHATEHLVPEIWSVPRGDVALTIDDGPSPYTEQMIQVLNRYHVHATFFFIGDQVPSWPNAVRDAIASGDVVGNHSETHPLLTDLPLSEQQTQIEEAQKVLEKYGASPTLFRPPYGAFNDFTEQVLAKDGLSLALWNRDPRDWADGNPQQLVDAVVNGNPSGGIFDMHDKLVTLEALPTIIEKLQQRGLHFVVLGREESVHRAGAGSMAASSSHSNKGNSWNATQSADSRTDRHGATGSTGNSTAIEPPNTTGNATASLR